MVGAGRLVGRRVGVLVPEGSPVGVDGGRAGVPRGSCVLIDGIGRSEEGHVLKFASEEQIEDGGVEVHGAEFGDGAEAEACGEGGPLGGGVVAVEALDGVGGVGGPVDEGDALLGEGSGDLVVLDDDESAGDAGALSEEAVGVFLVVEDIGDDDDIVGVVGIGECDAVVGADGDGLAASCEAFESGDADALGAVGGLHDGLSEDADAAADIEDGVLGLEVRDDGADEGAFSRFVDGRVERFHG